MKYSKLSAQERHEIAMMAAADYRVAGEGVENHAAFDGRYAEEFVWARMIKHLGFDRADNVSTRNFRRLVDEAIKCQRSVEFWARWAKQRNNRQVTA